MTIEALSKRPSVTIVGTIHLYEEARPRLRAILDELAPRVVTVEISRFSIEFRQRHLRIWEERFNLAVMRLGLLGQASTVLELLKRQISMPYEWQVAYDFGRETGARVIPIDLSELSKTELPLWEKELLSEESIKNAFLASKERSIQGHFDAIKRKASSLLRGDGHQIPEPLHPLAWLGDPYWEKRERMLFQRIMRILRVTDSLVHISGWMHCVTGSPWRTLADYLMDAGRGVRVVAAF